MISRVPADQRKTRKLTATKLFVHERWFNNTFSLEGDIAIIKLPTKMRERDVLKPCTDFEGNFSSFHKFQGLVILKTIKNNLVFERLFLFSVDLFCYIREQKKHICPKNGKSGLKCNKKPSFVLPRLIS